MSGYFTELVTALNADEEIDEVGIIMGAPPPAIVVVEHKLGISMGILKPLFTYASAEFHVAITRLRSQPAADVPTYRKDCTHALDLSKAVLLVKGDIAMVLNFRKEMMLAAIISYESELRFLSMLFTKHPKSPGAWQHRRWCLLHMLADGHPVNVELEKDLCRSMAELYPKNYYAWNHRLWLLTHMTRPQVSYSLTVYLTITH